MGQDLVNPGVDGVGWNGVLTDNPLLLAKCTREVSGMREATGSRQPTGGQQDKPQNPKRQSHETEVTHFRWVRKRQGADQGLQLEVRT